MKSVEIIGYKRANLGKTEAKRLRAEGMVPGVLYGGEEQIHFYAPMILFRELVYTDEAHFINLNVEGQIFEAILQDIQFHPVSEMIVHVDFLQLFRGTKIKMNIPVHPVGTPPGIQQGGKLIKKLRFLTVKALPKDMPEHINIDVSKLGLGKSVKVGDVPTENFEVLNNPLVTIMGIEIPRALRGKSLEGEEEGEEGAEGSEEAAEAPAEG
ncbi:50S ribosomal protein L25/general stress protein Ctc [Marinoscillum sp. 108]|jgi:large subunit ribosomal protein L25|uniref:Large ribosomal subunit protein bL25 n=1 Tax=Marinoscillum luteum TaxID=861051 RepID=A0ABW7N2M1_9BACT|nr:50S ribosomal protein L25/general stress protein Ctc [Marinoscillum sp. 108]VXD12639.1 50S ribosomal protein L25 [Marinoscillum sp. 108]